MTLAAPLAQTSADAREPIAWTEIFYVPIAEGPHKFWVTTPHGRVESEPFDEVTAGVSWQAPLPDGMQADWTDGEPTLALVGMDEFSSVLFEVEWRTATPFEVDFAGQPIQSVSATVGGIITRGGARTAQVQYRILVPEPTSIALFASAGCCWPWRRHPGSLTKPGAPGA